MTGALCDVTSFQPFSFVEIDMLATGAVDADPSRIVSVTPPLVQILKNEK
jgi:hypothetical protein